MLVMATLTTLASAQVKAPAAGAAPVTSHPAKPAFPQLNLPERKSQGQRAIDLLGERLPDVAAWYGKSLDEFRALLLQDRRLKIDQRGRLFVEDELEVPLPATPASSSASSSLTGTLAPPDQTFLLHSHLGASRTIYLNFRGAQISNTAWNGSAGTLTALPFDTDGIPYSYSTAELERIQYIWQRVVEDYAPFDVDVTTELPPADRLTRSGSTDTVFGTTVVITSRSGVYSCSCGGVAYIGIFDDTSDYYKPALVFYDALGPGNEKYVAEAISHEAGHNMALLHDGYSGGSYYSGQGSGVTGWAPIMGVGYYQPLAQWSKGEYATATPLSGASASGITTLATEGVIERPSDVDVFSFASGAGMLSFNLAPSARAANLDALAAALSWTAPSAGTYYLSVQGVGKGDPLTGSVPSPASQAPVASMSATPSSGTVPLTSNFSSTGSYDPDGNIVAYEWSFGDGSALATGPAASHVYNAAGSYNAQLKLTDNSGLTSTSSVTISAQAPVALIDMKVANIAMSLTLNKSRTAGATVTGTWSGIVSGSASGATDSNGVLVLASPNTRSSGTFIFTVTGVSLNGYSYQPGSNTETSDSITR